MLTFKFFLLQEKIFNVNKDVDYIWKKYFVPFISKLKKYSDYNEIMTLDKGKSFSSVELPSKDAKKAHKINPITINIYSGDLKGSGPVYVPTMNIINIDFMNLIHFANSKEEYIKEIEKILHSSKQIKSSIAHEISHWLDDSLHNKWLSKQSQSLSSQAEIAATTSHPKTQAWMIKKMRGKAKLTPLSTMEIEGNIHTVAELKRHYTSKEWDKISFDDVVNETKLWSLIRDKAMHLELSFTDEQSTEKILKKYYKKFKQLMMKRMAREGLLGKKMR